MYHLHRIAGSDHFIELVLTPIVYRIKHALSLRSGILANSTEQLKYARQTLFFCSFVRLGIGRTCRLINLRTTFRLRTPTCEWHDIGDDSASSSSAEYRACENCDKSESSEVSSSKPRAAMLFTRCLGGCHVNSKLWFFVKFGISAECSRGVRCDRRCVRWATSVVRNHSAEQSRYEIVQVLCSFHGNAAVSLKLISR